ncbi:hypothetical protein HY086_01950 [Candidatus Gottesmanbacteria bacterium]|nr:hypothetical protein [Candidatus Gottesmanbacteria bacterium]
MSPVNLIISSLLLLLTVNAVILDLVIFSRLPTQRESVSVIQPSVSAECPVACLSLVNEKLSAQKIQETTTAAVVSPQLTSSSSAKEYYVPLGSGTTRQTDYQELTSVEAYVDPANYSPIKQAYFQVHLRNTTGNGAVFAKLYNVTDKHDVWLSEVSFEGGGTDLREAKITLDRGNKLYRVMIKATLQYDVYVDNARIRIVTQ